MKTMSTRLRAFTLIELSLVVAVMGILAAAALRVSASTATAKNYAELNSTLDVIETALLNFRNTYGRLPCPSTISYPENNASFGKEHAVPPGSGYCNGLSVGIFYNIATDPDASDPNYDSAIIGMITQGGVPTRALGLPDKYAYDPWGRKIFYSVDARATTLGSFTTYPINNTVIGGIVVKSINAVDTTHAHALTYKALYTLVSMGKTGHGAWTRGVTTTPVVFNAGSTNTNMINNSHYGETYNTLFTRIFMYSPVSANYPSTSNSTVFDSVVRFKTRAQLASPAELQ